MLSFVRIAFLAACAVALASPSPAQQTVDVGSVSGRVVDESGASIPGATVRATQQATNIVASAITDSEGHFRLPYLKIGVYEVAVSLTGFKDSTRRISVSAPFIGSAATSDCQQPLHRGAHALRAGIDVLYNDDLITFPRSVRGAYSFSSLATFCTYNNAGYSQTFGITELAHTNPNLGLYVQDEWKLSSAVTLNAGLRYDLQWLESINTDDNNVSPRVGVAWAR